MKLNHEFLILADLEPVKLWHEICNHFFFQKDWIGNSNSQHLTTIIVFQESAKNFKKLHCQCKK